jgi:hypothetical protein
MEQVSSVAANSALIICELAIVVINNKIVMVNSFFIFTVIFEYNKVKYLKVFQIFLLKIFVF